MIVVTPLVEDIEKYNVKAIVNVSCEPCLLFKSKKPYFWFPINELNWFGYAPFFTTLRIYEKYKTIIIHCHAGINRSPTVAYAIWKALDLNEKYLFCAGPKNIFDIFYENIEKNYVPNDIIEFLKYANKHKKLGMTSCLYKINSNNLTYNKNSEILPRKNIENYINENDLINKTIN